MKLDKDKKYIFKKELLIKDLKERNQPLVIGHWADVINNKEVKVIEDGSRVEWVGNVKYPIGQNFQVIPERWMMEPEWLEEKE